MSPEHHHGFTVDGKTYGIGVNKLTGSDEMDPVTGDQGLERNPLVLIFRIHKSRGKNAIILAKVIGNLA